MTIREIITNKSAKLRSIDQLGGEEASKELVELSSLLSSINKEISDSLYWLNIKKMELLKEHGAAAKAKIYAEATKEFNDWHERLLQGKAVEEMIRSLKYFLRNLETEKRESSY